MKYDSCQDMGIVGDAIEKTNIRLYFPVLL